MHFGLMIYFRAMKLRHAGVSCFLAAAVVSMAVTGSAFSQEHIRELGAVREAMAQVGNKLPELIKKSDPKYLRTLERTFEINNYALVTIESYMKMVKVAITSGGAINKEIVAVLNGWLGFIRHYCEYDVKYFDEALLEVKDADVVSVLKSEQANIVRLKDISDRGIAENTELAKKL